MGQPIAFEELEWKEKGMDLIKELAASGAPFDAYALTEKGLADPPHPNKWGSLFRAARSRRLIEHAGFHRSSRPSRSGGVCQQWRGLPEADK